MNKCGYCGIEFEGEGVDPIEQGPIVVGGSDGDETEVSGWFKASFCSGGCAWAYGIESHSLYSMTGKDARKHLVKVHGLSPGKPAGRISKECFDRFIEIANVFGSFMEGGVQAVKFKDS